MFPSGECELDGMKDDSARDKAIDRLVAGKLSARLRDDGTECPDPETLAAYVERTLSEGERWTWETHLAACRRCQEQVTELVRMDEADELSYEALPPRVPRKVPWFRWAFVAPVLLALVVAALWYPGELSRYLRPPEQAAVSEPEPVEAASDISQSRGKDAEKPLPATRKYAEAEPPKQEAPKPTSQRESAPRMSVYGSPGSSVETRPGEGRDVGSGVVEEADLAAAGEPTRTAAARARAAVSNELSRRAADEFRATPGAQPSGAPAASSAAIGQAGRPQARGEELSKGATRGEVSAKKAVSGGVRADMAQQVAAPSDSGVEFHGFIRDRRTWRVGRNGLIQKAASDGSWETRPSGINNDLFGISFATPKVGWAVGQGGTVLRTTDGGATWTRMPNPTSEDLVRVGAIDEMKVNVIARSGVTLQSADGGRTWKPLRKE